MRQGSENKGIKTHGVFLFFSGMENKFTEEHERFQNTLSDRPPPPFHVWDIVVRQPSEREIYEK